MVIMRGIYTCTPFLIILMSGSSLCQHHVCLKYKDRGDTIDIICSVDRLKFQIMFKNPDGEENGYCGSPIRGGNESDFCNGKFNINQSLTTDTTTLIIKKNELMYGEWKCYHGTNFGFDSLDIKMPDTNASSQATGDAQLPSEINKDCPNQREYGTVYMEQHSSSTCIWTLLTVDISPTVSDVLEEDNQTITCTVSGKPVATDISWTKFSNGGFKTIDRTAVPEKYLGGTNENPTLVIKNFTTSDTGIYVCKATNAVGTASSQPAVLTCKRKTSIAMSPEGSIWIGLGGTTKLTAHITTTSVDSVKIYWQRVENNNTAINIVLNTTKYSGSSRDFPVPELVINDIDTTDAGLYQIEITTITGSFIGPRVAVKVIGEESNTRWIIIILKIIVSVLACFGLESIVLKCRSNGVVIWPCCWNDMLGYIIMGYIIITLGGSFVRQFNVPKPNDIIYRKAAYTMPSEKKISKDKENIVYHRAAINNT